MRGNDPRKDLDILRFDLLVGFFPGEQVHLREGDHPGVRGQSGGTVGDLNGNGGIQHSAAVGEPGGQQATLGRLDGNGYVGQGNPGGAGEGPDL